MRKYTKYTQKIIDFLDSHKTILPNRKYTSQYALYLSDEYHHTVADNVELVLHTQINPLNTSSTPLLYTIFSTLGIKGAFVEFLDWFRPSFPDFNFKEFVKQKDQQYYDVLFHPIEPRKQLHRLLYGNSFIPLDVMHYAEITPLWYDVYKGAKTNIHVYSEDSFDVQPIVKIISFFRRLTGKKDIAVTLVLLLSNQRKQFPDNNSSSKTLITPENMNSGCAVAGSYVYIWRKEELIKVLIHELVHYFELDFQNYNDATLGRAFHRLIHVKGQDAINETYTELLAITIYSSIQHMISFDMAINYEIAFTHFQIAKIIWLFGGKTYDDLYKITIRQNTSLASYIIAKGMLLNDYQRFLDIHRPTKPAQYDKYTNLYIQSMHRGALNADTINYFLNVIAQKEDGKFIFKTLRMTAFG